MRHTRLERWSRQDSPIHRLHATAKILAVLTILICTATLTLRQWPIGIIYFALLCTTMLKAQLPLPSLLKRAAAILPFALCFGLISALSGDPQRAAMLLVRGYLSALAALLLIATTSQPAVISGLEYLHAPRFLLQVMQFLYRYLIVLSGEAAAMRDAGLSRGGAVRTLEIKRAAGAAAVLFSKAYTRATSIHQAMCARGFAGAMPQAYRKPLAAADLIFLAATATAVIATRVVLA